MVSLRDDMLIEYGEQGYDESFKLIVVISDERNLINGAFKKAATGEHCTIILIQPWILKYY